MSDIETEFKKSIANGDEVAKVAYADWLEDQGRLVDAAKARARAGVSELRFAVVSNEFGAGLGEYHSLSGARGAITRRTKYAKRTDIVDKYKIDMYELRRVKIETLPPVNPNKKK